MDGKIAISCILVLLKLYITMLGVNNQFAINEKLGTKNWLACRLNLYDKGQIS